MTQKEISLLINLLKKLKREKLTPPNMPFTLWRTIISIVPIPSVEVIITRSGKDFLLTYRKDQDWDGWHIPGGFILPRESIENACQRVAQKELGMKVEFQKIVSAFSWPDSPYGNDFSLICICSTGEEPKVGKFFTEIPEKIVSHHREFLEKFLN